MWTTQDKRVTYKIHCHDISGALPDGGRVQKLNGFYFEWFRTEERINPFDQSWYVTSCDGYIGSVLRKTRLENEFTTDWDEKTETFRKQKIIPQYEIVVNPDETTVQVASGRFGPGEVFEGKTRRAGFYVAKLKYEKYHENGQYQKLESNYEANDDKWTLDRIYSNEQRAVPGYEVLNLHDGSEFPNSGNPNGSSTVPQPAAWYTFASAINPPWGSEYTFENDALWMKGLIHNDLLHTPTTGFINWPPLWVYLA